MPVSVVVCHLAISAPPDPVMFRAFFEQGHGPKRLRVISGQISTGLRHDKAPRIIFRKQADGTECAEKTIGELGVKFQLLGDLVSSQRRSAEQVKNAERCACIQDLTAPTSEKQINDELLRIHFIMLQNET